MFLGNHRSTLLALLVVPILVLTSTAPARAAVIRVEVEDYIPGGQNVGYYDTTPGNIGGSTYRAGDDVDLYDTASASNGHSIGSVATGEWLKYDLNAPQAGSYVVVGAFATDGYPGSRTIEIAGTNLGNISVLNTGGWSNFQRVVFPAAVQLSAGSQEFKSTANSLAHNLDYFEFISAAPAPGSFEAEDFVDFYDHTGSNPSGPEIAAGGSGGFNVAEVYTGEWLSYYADVTAPGHYWLRGRAATTLSGRQLDVQVDGVNQGTMNIANTGGWATFRPTSVVHLPDLTPGFREIKLVANTTGQNLDMFDIIRRPVAPESFEAEDFLDYQGANLAIAAGGSGGEHVGNIYTNYYMTYEFEVPAPGYYGLRGYAATALTGLQSHLELDGNNVGNIDVPATGGWTNFAPAPVVYLDGATPGVHQLKLVAHNSGQNWDKFDLIQLQPVLAGTVIEAESYSLYNDVDHPTDPNPNGPDVLSGGSGQMIGYIYSGEWLAYDVYVPHGGSYQLYASLAVPEAYAPDTLGIQIDGVGIGEINFGATGGFNTFQEFRLPGQVFLSAGYHEIRVLANTDVFNFDYLHLQVPEPSALVLSVLGFGTVGLLLLRRRRR